MATVEELLKLDAEAKARQKKLDRKDKLKFLRNYILPTFISGLLVVFLSSYEHLGLDPIWVGLFILPTIGLPVAIQYLTKLKNEIKQINIRKFPIILFLVGPLLGLIFGFCLLEFVCVLLLVDCNYFGF